MDANGGRVVTSQLADINGQSSSSLNVACTSAEGIHNNSTWFSFK